MSRQNDMYHYSQGDYIIDQMKTYARRALALGADAVLLCIRDTDTVVLFGLKHEGKDHVGTVAQGSRDVIRTLSALGFRADDAVMAIAHVSTFADETIPVDPMRVHFRIACIRRRTEGAAGWNPDMAFPCEPPPDVKV